MGGTPDDAAGDPPWTDDHLGDDAGDRGRRRLLPLLAGAAVLWIVVGVAVIGGDRDPDEPAGTDAEKAAQGTAAPRTATAGTATAGTAASGGASTAPSGAGGAAPPAEADVVGACAEIGLHDALTTDDAVRWVDAAAPEGRVRAAPPPGVDVAGDEETVVVVVRALLLEGDGDAWRDRRPARFAVPLALGRGAACRVASPPWPLPDPASGESTDVASPSASPGPAAPSGGPDGPEQDAVVALLTGAGYRDVEVVGVEGGDIGGGDVKDGDGGGSTAAATVRARAPGAEHVEVWSPWVTGPPLRLVGS